MIFGKEVVQYQNNLYYIYRKLKPGSVKEGRINDLKEFWMCDIALRQQETILFCRHIPNAEIVE